jgi:hypothetical protein
MQRTTVLTYPHLVAAKPIKGVVYRATDVVKPRPKITVMSSDEVQMHQKREGSDILHREVDRCTISRRNRYRHPSIADAQPRIPDCTTAAPAVVESNTNHDIPVLSHANTNEARATSEEKEPSPFQRLKVAMRNVLQSKDPNKSTETLREEHQNASDSLIDTCLQAGFHCARDGCESCVFFVASINSTAAPQIGVSNSNHEAANASNKSQPIIQSPSNFSSEFTTSLSVPSSSSPSEVSPTSINLDIFHDFNGIHIDPTSSSFVENPRSTIVSHTTDDPAADWFSCDDDEEGVDDTQLTAPDLRFTSQASSCSDEDWYTEPPTPSPHGIDIPYDQREWSFEISSIALRV